MTVIDFNMYMTAAVAVAAVYLGEVLRERISVLKKYCIPASVVGGLFISVLVFVLYVSGTAEISFTDTFGDISMMFFFASVGFLASLKTLRSGQKDLFIFLALLAALIILQNVTAVGIAALMGLDPKTGLCAGSVPMTGGHATAAAFGPLLQAMGIRGAASLSTACATYGLIAGSLIGGPLANHLITKKDLLHTAVPLAISDDEAAKKRETVIEHYAYAVAYLLVVIGAGSIISSLISATGLTFPAYIGAMIAAAIVRNVFELTGREEKIYEEEISILGGFMLSLFLAIAMIRLQLWELGSLALPLIVLMLAQTLLMFVFARFAVFRMMGGDYDAAVICSGFCGFGMGATPNAMANMAAVCNRYKPSVKAFLLIPIVGSLFADFLNSFIITLFMNLL